MRDPVSLGNLTVDREEIAAVLPENGSLYIFLKSAARPIMLRDSFSREEKAALVSAAESKKE